MADLDGLALGVVAIVALLALAAVLIPLLLFGIELIVLGLAIAIGMLGRTLLRRPWIVQASTVGDEKRVAMTWRVVGWRRSNRLIEEVAGQLEAGLSPAPSEATELILAPTG